MAKKKMIINNWPPGQGKKSGNVAFNYAWKFADLLKDAVGLAVKEVATNISSAPETAYGTSARVGRTDGSTSSGFAQTFAATADLNSALGGNKYGHANAYARHFTAGTGKTTHMDYGNLIEQVAFKKIKEWQDDGWLTCDGKGYDFLYNDPNAYSGRFAISYKGTSKSARPDFRVSLVAVGMVGCEAIYDVTSLGDMGHLIKKKVNTTTLDQIPGIVVGYEIFYTDTDVQQVW